jgi:HEAT repeat protein
VTKARPTVTALARALNPPGLRAWAACKTLGRMKSAEALSQLIQLTGHPDWRYRRAAIEAIGTHALSKNGTAAERILAALTDTSLHVVKTACESAANLKLLEAHDLIAGLLSAEDYSVRESAVRALSELWRETDLARLLDVYRRDRSEEVRRQAAFTLWNNASTSSWRTLFDAFRIDGLHRHRVWACELVSKFGDRQDKESIRALLHDENGHVRKAAAKALKGE